MNVRLTIRDLSLARGRRRVLDGFSLEVNEGEVFGLLGPNGAGKSSAFLALAGLLPAESGEVLYEGERLAPGERRLRSRMGVVFQSPALDERLSPRVNLRLAAALAGLPAREARPRVEEMLEFAELTDRAAEPVKQLSGGMRRRLELARAMLSSPPFLLLDEPTTGLDEPSFRRVWRAYRSLADDRGVSLLLTTHRAEEAELCDRLAFLHGGRIVARGTPEELRKRVGGDVIELEAGDPREAAEQIAAALALAPEVRGNRVRLVVSGGHTVVPRIAELFPDGRLRSIELHRPGLADVFLTLTGHDLAGEAEA